MNRVHVGAGRVQEGVHPDFPDKYRQNPSRVQGVHPFSVLAKRIRNKALKTKVIAVIGKNPAPLHPSNTKPLQNNGFVRVQANAPWVHPCMTLNERSS